MATSVGSIQYDASIDLPSLRKSISQADKMVEGSYDKQEKAGKTVSKKSAAVLGAIAGAAATVAASAISLITSSIDSAITRVDTLNNSARTFENMGIRSSEASKAMKALEKSITGLPTPLDSAVRGMTALTATYGDIDKGQKVFSALNNAILGFGGSAAMVDNAIMQLSQLPMDGPLDAQTWNSLRNSGLTPVLTAMAKDSGTSVSAMKKAFGQGELTVQDFTDRLVKMDKEGGGGLKSLEKIAMDSTKGIGTSLANMQTAITKGVEAVIESIGRDNITAVIGGIGTVIRTVLVTYSGAVTAMIKYGKQLYEFLKPTLETIGTVVSNILKPSIDSLKQSFQEIYKATEPYHHELKMVGQFIGAILIGVVVALGAAILGIVVIIAKVLEIGAKFLAFWIKLGITVRTTMEDAGAFVRNSISNIIGWFASLPSKIGSAIGNMGSVLYNTGRDLIQGLLNGASSLLKTVGQFFASKLPGALQGPFKKALGIQSPSKVFAEYGKNIAQGLAGGVDKYSPLSTSAIDGLTSDLNVSDRRPELVIPKQKVSSPATQSSQLGSNVTVNLSMSGVMTSSKADERAIATRMAKLINETVRAKTGSTAIQGV